jgi:CHAD domain-containing protein
VASKNPAHKQIGKHLKKQVDAALDSLEKTRISDEDVHQARKALKKARASLRLLLPAFKDADYRRVNADLRDAAKPLSSVRDAKVLLDTLQTLVERYGLPERALKLDGLTRVLRSRRAHIRRDLLSPNGGALGHSRQLLRQSRTGIDDLVDRHEEEWKIIGAGLKRVYAQGRRALADAREKPRPDAFHEWRKEAKYLRYALERLDPLWSSVVGALADQAHKLADYLGDEHDLTVLRETALAHHDCFSDEQTLPALLALIDRCQAALREKAIYLGARLYEEKPRAFAARFGQYWKITSDRKAA